MNPCIIPKRRAPRRSSVLFASISTGTNFWLPGRKPKFIKLNFCRAELDGEKVFVNPFRSVFVTPAKSPPGETLVEQVIREGNAQITAVQESGRTHFVGDDCPGGHADVPVNNDNNITGPTS